MDSGRTHGLEPRITDAIGFASRARVLLLRHVPTGIDVDVSFGGLPFEDEALIRASEGKLGELVIPLPTPEDLVIMKAVAHRPRDAADIEGLIDANPDIDRERILRWVREFAEALDTPEILMDIKQLLKRAPARRRPRKGDRKK